MLYVALIKCLVILSNKMFEKKKKPRQRKIIMKKRFEQKELNNKLEHVFCQYL